MLDEDVAEIAIRFPGLNQQHRSTGGHRDGRPWPGDPVAQHDLDPRTVHGDQPRVGAQVGDLVLQRLSGRGVRRGLRFARVDVRAQLRDLPPVTGVGRFELLDVVQEGLVTGHLVGRRKELSSDLVGKHKTRHQGDKRDEAEAG